ncbi:MAG: GNAT family N-acetyltransferase [Pseudomonadota bacterium]|nr:GNAT family N-acetyltransferase [Pseudomonadota bacterium]
MNSVIIRPLERSDNGDWLRLWSEYLAFYQVTRPLSVYESTWTRLFIKDEFEPKCLLAFVQSKAVGLAHYLYHRSCWSVSNSCYLQDLFTDPGARGKGVGGALIEAVREEAAKTGVINVYWMTHETNAAARRLYDRVARKTGFVEYDLL